MTTVEVTLVQPGYGFEAVDQSNKSFTMDTAPDHGGQDYGVRPMQALLMSLGGCSGIDIVSILTKQRQNMTSLKITVSGEREKDMVPALWKTAHVIFHIGGEVTEEKANYAAKLSIEKYCSVAETLRRAGCEISYEVKLNSN